MAGIFGAKPTPQAASQPALTGVPIQTSVEGKAIPLLYGTTRVAPNLIGLLDFVATPHTEQNQQGGGKGGLLTSGNGGGGGQVTYTYKSALMLGFCEGPIRRFGHVYVNKGVFNFNGLNYDAFLGTVPQSPWSYLVSNHPEQALHYPGVAYAAVASYDYGNSPNLPNQTFEVYGLFSDSVAGVQNDADPSLIVVDIASNQRTGAGFPADKIGPLTDYQNWVYACGLFISPLYDSQRPARDMLAEIADLTNAEWRWSSSLLTLIPRGDTQVSGNGKVYTPPSAPEFDLTYDDFLPPGGGNSSATDPVRVTRKRPSDVLNSYKLEYLDRNSDYNPATVQDKDDALIRSVGIRQAPVIGAHMFCNGTAAQLAVSMQLRRQTIRNQYEFTVDQRYIVLDPMDLVTITDPQLGLDRQWVRILEITENGDKSLTMIAEEYPFGTGSAALFSYGTGTGYAANFNADPGSINDPLIFEPTFPLVDQLKLCAAVSGQNRALWGGCTVWASTDGINYRNYGRINGPARMGVLTANLDPVPVNPTGGATIDRTNTMAVDASESGGEFASDTESGLLALNGLLYVGGEFLAYQNALLTGPNKYNLSTLNRGAYNTTSSIVTHPAGSLFTRMDSAVYAVPFVPDRVGQTIYFKFTSFNIFGGGEQSLDSVSHYTYVVKGTALSRSLPAMTDLRESYSAHVDELWWKEVTGDFRPIVYEIRLGETFEGALPIARQAHPPFVTTGNGRYWVASRTEPLSGLVIYGAAQSYDVKIASLTFGNEVAEADFTPVTSYDEKALGWPGTFYGGVGIDHVTGIIRTGGGGDILGVVDFLGLVDVINYGGQQSGGYQQPDTHWVDLGRVMPFLLQIDYEGAGQPLGQDILGAGDFLGLADVLGAENTKFVSVRAEYAIATTVFRELYEIDDLYANPPIDDLYSAANWGPWTAYSPGVKYGRVVKCRLVLETDDGNTIAVGLKFKITVSAPKRIDHYGPVAIPAAGKTITFVPDGVAAAAPFNGGPNGAMVPLAFGQIYQIPNSWRVLISSVTKTSMFVQVVNGSGVGQDATVDVLNVEGY